jgi:hypothetical protein
VAALYSKWNKEQPRKKQNTTGRAMYNKMNVPDLRGHCSDRGLATGGFKDDLILRLVTWETNQCEDGEEVEEEDVHDLAENQMNVDRKNDQLEHVEREVGEEEEEVVMVESALPQQPETYDFWGKEGGWAENEEEEVEEEDDDDENQKYDYNEGSSSDEENGDDSGGGDKEEEQVEWATETNVPGKITGLIRSRGISLNSSKCVSLDIEEEK